MSVIKEIADSAVVELKTIWNGRLPTWEEYLEAYRAGRVRANRTVAVREVHSSPVPASYKIIYGGLTMWMAFLLVPAAVLGWFLADTSAWWILGALLASRWLVRVSREGHCEGIKAGAARSKDFYEYLVSSGAFLFESDGDLSR